MKRSSAQQTTTTQPSSVSNDIWSVQCGECFKWRVIPTQEEYEDIRSKFIEDPFVCNKNPNTNCDHPANIQYDNSRTWVIDKPNLPKAPPGFKREIRVRKNFEKIDCSYYTPKGKIVRSLNELSDFLDENQEYRKDISESDFSFIRPKLMKDTLPAKRRRHV